MWALLRHEPIQMTLDEFMRLGDWVLVNGVGRPNQHHDHPERGYWPVGRSAHPGEVLTPTSWRTLFMDSRGRALRTLGASDSEVEAAYAEWAKGMRPGHR